MRNRYTLQINDGESTGATSYTITSGSEYATVNSDGVVTIIKSGTVKITATKAGDDKYNAATDTFTLTIEKADQSFTFGHSDAIEGKDGLTSFETKILPYTLNSGVITYAVSNNTIGATVNNSGLVSFANSTGKVGTITVTVTMEGNECYNAFSDSYTITFGYEAAPAPSYVLSGDKIINGSAWFTGDVTIAAPNDYQISYNNNLTGTEWTNSVIWNTDGEAGTWAAGSEPVVYLKNSTTGAITTAIPVDDLKRDTVAPTDLSIHYTVNPLKTILGEIFGFGKDTVQVTVSASDATSGIAKMEYSLNEGADYTAVTAQNNEYKFSVAPQYRGQIWLRATDTAGNESVWEHKDGETAKILVVDSVAPGINVSYESSVANTAVAFPYNKTGVNAIITVDEANFFEGNVAGADNGAVVHELLIQVTKTDDNGAVTVTEYLCANADALVPDADKKEIITWTLDNGKYTVTIPFVDDGDYVLKIGYVDYSGNEAEISGTDRNEGTATYTSQVITVDKTAPVITVTYDNKDAKNGSNYNADRTATITVTEHNFKAEDFVAAVTAKNILNEKVSVMDYAQYAADPDNWTHAGNVHTLKLPFTVDAIYTFDVAYTDLAGNGAADFAEETYVIDHKAAETSRSLTARLSLRRSLRH